jgi:putative ABC transport system permease protein
LAGAIGFGFLIITLLNGATAGIEDSIRVNFASLLGGHLYVSGEELLDSGRTVSSVQHPEAINEAVMDLSVTVTDVSRRSRAQADVIFGSRTTRQLIEGVNFDKEQDVFDALEPVAGSVDALADRPDGILLPASVAETIGAVPGEIVILRLSTVTGQSSVGEAELIATFEEPQEIGISRGYMHLATVNELIGLDKENFQSLNIYLADARQMNVAANELTRILGEDLQVADRQAGTGGFSGFGFGTGEDEEPWEGVRYEVTTLEDLLGQVLAILETVDAVALVVFLTLLVISMVGITNTYRMVVLERQNEIGTMRALGMHRKHVRNLFLSEAAVTAALGILAGGVLAALLMLVLGALPIDNPALQFITQDGSLRFVVSPLVALRNIAIVLAVSAFAAFFPARQGARLRPVDALRATV